MLLTFLILGITIALFVFTPLRADVVAMLSLLALFVTGILTTKQALAGFSDSTTVMIAALFVVGEGLSRTGVTAWLGQALMQRAGASPTRLLIVAMAGTALLSGVLSNTGTVAVLLPAVVAVAWKLGRSPSRFLMPVAIAANLGGLLTLIGSPPNIVVSDTMVAAGAPPFGFFAFAWVGIPLVLAAIAFMTLFGQRLLRDRETGGRPVEPGAIVAQLAEEYQIAGHLHRVTVRPTSPLAGQTLRSAALGRDFGLAVLLIETASQGAQPEGMDGRPRLRTQLEQLRGAPGEIPGAETQLQAGDILLVDGTADAVQRAAEAFDLAPTPVATEDSAQLSALLLSQEIGVAEVLVAPRSADQGRTLTRAQIGERYGVQVLAMRRGARLLVRQKDRLQVGDSLLVRGRWSRITALGQAASSYVVVGDPDAVARQVASLNFRSWLAVAILAAMVVLMLTNSVPTVIAVLLAAAAMVLAGCLPVTSIYPAIHWPTVVLIAAMLPMSTALEVTGGAQFVADTLVALLGGHGPLLLMSGIFLLTNGFSQVMSNTATTVLVAPIAYSTAIALGVAPEPLLMMVAAGAAAAFLTPIASPTNTLVFVPGGYTWGDYARVGLPLAILVLLVSLVVVPLVWPL